MTDSKALIERLRVNVPYEAPRCLEAADYIEKLEADNARLRLVNKTLRMQRDKARAALQETKP